MKRLTALLILALGLSPAAPVEADVGFTDLGAVSDISRTQGAAATVDAEGNRIVVTCLYSHRHQSVLVVNVDTGEARQFDLAGPPSGAHGPHRLLLSSRERIYLCVAGYFYEFDPEAMDFTFVQDLEGLGSFSDTMGFAEDEAGVIWAGLFPGAALVSFDPESRELTNYGSLNEETWNQYPLVAVDEAGWVYMGIRRTRAQVVAFHPESGETRRLVAEEERVRGWAHVFLGEDGRVYGRAPGWGWHELRDGEAIAIDEPAEKAKRDGDAGAMSFASRSVSTAGRDPLAFPDGSVVTRLDPPRRYLKVEELDGSERRVRFDYESGGSVVFSLLVKDGSVHGSTGRPNTLFRYDPETGEKQAVYLEYGGRWNAVAVQRDEWFGATYSYGRLISFDFDEPLEPGTEPGSNPRKFFRSGDNVNRPSVLLAHPDDRHLVMGGTPGYGMTGGGLTLYDLEEEKGERLTHEDLLENHSTHALVGLPGGDLVVGSSTSPGTGGQRLAEAAALYLFDWGGREVVWQEYLPGHRRVNELVLGPDNLVYGLVETEDREATLLVFDPEDRDIRHQESLDYGRPCLLGRSLAVGPDGNLYAVFFGGAVVRIQAGTFEAEKLAESPVEIRAGLAVHGKELYFGSGSNLWKYRIPR